MIDPKLPHATPNMPAVTKVSGRQAIHTNQDAGDRSFVRETVKPRLKDVLSRGREVVVDLKHYTSDSNL
jgi:hypothetical protein